jgi:hypothetical protein
LEVQSREDSEYLELINRRTIKRQIKYFEGIDTSWNRVKEETNRELLKEIISQYDFSNPSASIPNLAKAYVMIQALDENH